MAVPFSTIHRWDFCRALYMSHYNNKIVLSATDFFHDAPQLHHFDNKIGLCDDCFAERCICRTITTKFSLAMIFVEKSKINTHFLIDLHNIRIL